MATVLFNQWLTDVRHEFKAAGRRVFMIMDNCSSHKVLLAEEAEVTTHVIHDINVVQVDNMWVIYPALIQPLDQGIIAMVKARYRAWFLRWLIDLAHRATARRNLNRAPPDELSDHADSVVEITEETPLHKIKPSYTRGIRHIARIWADVQPVHITNCWRRAGIVPASWTAAPTVEEEMLEREYVALQPLIEHVHPSRQNRFNAAEFVHDVPGEMEREDVNSDKEQSDGTPSSPPLFPGAIGAQGLEEEDQVLTSPQEGWPFFVMVTSAFHVLDSCFKCLFPLFHVMVMSGIHVCDSMFLTKSSSLQVTVLGGVLRWM